MSRHPRRPVTGLENADVRGLALCDPWIREDFIRRVEELRRKQEAYEKGLPTTVAAIAEEIGETLAPDDESYPAGFERAYRNILAIELIVSGADDSPLAHFDSEALALLARLARESRACLTECRQALDYLQDLQRKLWEAGRRLPSGAGGQEPGGWWGPSCERMREERPGWADDACPWLEDERPLWAACDQCPRRASEPLQWETGDWYPEEASE